MNCFYHNDRPAVAQCVECGKFLCTECASKRTPVVCDGCAEEITQAYQTNEKISKEKFKKSVKIAAIIGALMGIYMILEALGGGSIAGAILMIPVGLAMVVICAGLPFGWRSFNKYRQKLNFILILPIAGWIFYFSLKLTYSFMVGWLLMIKSLLQYKEIR